MIKHHQNTLSARPYDKVGDKILEVAAVLFAERGYAGTSVEKVITRCGIGKDTFYRRFNSKLALFEAMVLRERENVELRFAEFIQHDQGSRLDQLAAVLRWLLDINLEPRLIAFKRIAFTEASVVGKAAQDASSPITDHLVELVTALQSENVIRENAPHETAMFLINTVVLSPMMAAMLGDESVENPKWREDYFERTWPHILWGVCGRSK